MNGSIKFARVPFAGVSVSILSYCGEVTMGIIVDKALVSNPTRIVDGFCAKVHELAKQLNVLEDQAKVKSNFFVPEDEE